MVIEVVNQGGVAALETKDQAPIATDRDGPVPLQLALQGMQAPGRRAQVIGTHRLVQRAQLQSQTGRVGRQNACLAACLEKPLQALVSEALDHGRGLIVYGIDTRYNMNEAGALRGRRIFRDGRKSMAAAARWCAAVARLRWPGPPTALQPTALQPKPRAG